MKLPRLPIVIPLLALSAGLAAQGTQDAPIFRSRVNYIEVDVLVTDKKGNAVRDLTLDDITLLEDGKPQRISSFSLVDLPIETPAARIAAVDAIEPDVTTNTVEGRMYVMLLDSFGTNMHRARLIARQFVEEAVAPSDQVAVVHVAGNMSAAQGFTTNRRLILAAIDRLLGVGLAEGARPVTAGDPILGSFSVLEEMAQRLSLMSGRRKVVLWFDPPSVFIANNFRDVKYQFAQREAVRAATRNNVALYVVSTRGLSGAGILHDVGLRVLAEETGGDVIVNSNSFSRAFERFVRDNSSYYLLGYEPAVEHRDGEFHKLAVRVNRRDVTVRARPGYYAPEPDADADAPPALSIADGVSPATAQALRMPASVAGLGIELFAAPFKGPARNGSVMLGAHLHGTDLVLAAGERIEIAHHAMTPEGTITPGSFHVLRLDFTPESRAAIARQGIRLLDRIELPPGRHQVRFVAHQPNGKTGSVVADVEVPDYGADPLALSGVVLASEETSVQQTLLSDDGLKAIVGLEPTARRQFSRDDTLRVFAEVYPNRGIRVEDVQVRLRIARSGESRSTHSGARVTSDADRLGYVVRLPLNELSPGEYVLTFEARAGSHVALRELPLMVE